MSSISFEDYTPPSISTFCKSCNKEVSAHQEDWGIGAYEFWGAKGTQHIYVWVCDECEEEVEVDI